MKTSAILTIILVGCVLTLPFIFYGISFGSDDGIIHARWYFYFSEQFWAGDFYPRWLRGMNNGLGSPVFFYYPPLPYFLTSFLKPLFSNDIYGTHQLGISVVLALILSGLGANLWLKQVVNERSALIGAILYMASPYHLVADIYIRCSFAELWTFVWLPLILYFTHKILDSNRLAVVGLAVSYALLIMTHLPTTLIFSIVPLCYAIVLSSDQKLKTLGKIIGSMALGIGLSAIYLYPAMTTQQNVFVDRMTIGYFSYENWLFFSNISLWTEDKLVILFLILDLIGIAFCAFVLSRADFKLKKLRIFWLIVAASSVLMMTELGKPFWIIFSPLQKIQFPFRFNVILTLAASALIALALSTIKLTNFSKLKIITFLLIVAWIPALIWAGLKIFSADQNIANYQQRIEKSKDVPEYRPRWSESMNKIDWETSKNEDYWDTQIDAEYNALLQRVGVTKDGLPKTKIIEGTGQIEVISWKPREIILRANAVTEMQIYVSQFYYPNWTAQVIGNQSELNLQPSQPDGLLSFTVPKGDYEILLKLKQSKEEFIGIIISLSSILFLIIVAAICRLFNF